MSRTVAVVLAVIAASCNSGSAAPGPSSRSAPRDAAVDADVSRLGGKPLYLALCAPCHGADARGYAADHAPSLVNPTFLESASDEFLRRAIAAGRPGTSMAAYGRSSGGPLDDAGVDRLVAFLRALGPRVTPLPTVAEADPRASLQRRGATPERMAHRDQAAAGAAIYAKRCFSCHGDARTRGEAIWLANSQFQATASDAFVRHAIAAGRPGTQMEAFAGRLGDAELDSVVAYVRTLGGGGRAPATLLAAPTGKEPIVLNPAGQAPSFTLRAEPCPPAAPGAPACTPDPRFVSVEQVAKAYAAKQRMVIIDARPPSDWRRSRVAGAVSIPYHDLARLAELPRDGTWILAYCACPHHLSGIVIDELRKRGYAHTAVLDEGINEWHRRGLPVIAAEGVDKPLPQAPPPAGALR